MTEKVIFKVIRGEVVAFLPEVDANYGRIMCISMYGGGHGEGSMEYYYLGRPAKPNEYKETKKWLEDLYGYKLKVVHRIPYGMMSWQKKKNPTHRNPNGGGLFQKFHGANPTTRQVEFNPPKGKKLIKIGRAVSIVYEPEPPSKLAGKQFEHKWGDTGDRMLKHRPILCTDVSGKNFYLINDRANPKFSERGIVG